MDKKMTRSIAALALFMILMGSNVAGADENALTAPPGPMCADGDFLWEQVIDVTNLDSRGEPAAEVVLYRNIAHRSFTIPGPYPVEFSFAVTLSVNDTVAWDGYLERVIAGNQPNERYKLVFFKNGSFVDETNWTGDELDDGITTGWFSDFWRGALDQDIFLPDGTDEIRIIHWSDTDFGTGDTSSPNSVYPVSVCIGSSGPDASLGDRVWNDLNSDGVQDSVEPGIPNVSVSLLANCGTAAETVIATDTTDGSGLYLFEDLNGGDYCVEFDKTSAALELGCDGAFSPNNGDIRVADNSDADPSNGKTSVITLGDSEDNRDVDAGLSCPPLLGSLGDFVWQDLNADGIQNDGDTGIGGVTVNLFETDAAGDCTIPAGTTSTAADGSYLFNDLSEGAYCVQFVKENSLNCNAEIGGSVAFSPNNGGIDVVDNSDASTGAGFTSVINLGPGESNPNVDAGLYCPAKLGDRVWEDTNRDGIQDSDELGLADVEVTLLTCDADGNVTGSMGTAMTGTDGMYMFNPLMPGDYAVRFGGLTGYVFSPANADSDDAVDSDANTATGQTMCMPLESNQNDPTRDAGLFEAPLSGLGNFVWEDKNTDGIQNDGDTGVSGVMVTLLLPGTDGECNTDDDDITLSTATTDDNGEYMFENLFAGRYCVAFDISTAELACLYGNGPVFTGQNAVSNDAADSDADLATGKTGNIDLGFEEYDPTNDAGIYCPAKLGNEVWKDADEDGVQDDSELAVDDVEVNLYACDANGDIVNGVIDTALTSGGMYMFSGLMPGNYAVQFVAPGDLVFTDQDQGGDDALDSDADSAGSTECVPIGSNEYDDTRDAGLIDPPECGLGLVKTCEVLTPPSPPLQNCDQKVKSFTLIWNGSGNISVSGINNDAGGVIMPGDEVTFSGPFPSNDNFLTIAGVGESKFHISCSDEDMDGETDDQLFPSDCGKAEGDGKGTNSGFVNDWLFEGLTDGSGQVVDCTAPVTVPTSSCEFPTTVASCDTLPDKPTMFSFQYTGGGCAAADNSQGSKFDCSGGISAGSTVTLMTSAGETIEDVKPGDLVTIEKDGSETSITLDDGSGGIETIVFHTSCSAPLITGEVFGSLTLTALDGQGSGREVLYSYLINNGGSNLITDILVTDTVFGTIGTVDSLNPGDSKTLTAMSFVSETTTNVATAAGSGVGQCVASAEATVTVLPPPPCTVTSSFKQLKDDAIKYTVTNTGNSAATLDELTFDFPDAFVAIKEVKLDGAIYKSGDSPLVIRPGDTIGSSDWTKQDVSKRVLEPGESRTLEIKFNKKAKNFDQGDFSGTVKFNGGDCMILL